MFGKKSTPKFKETTSNPDWIWVTDYYDFPLTGMCKYEGKTYYAYVNDWETYDDIFYYLTELKGLSKLKWYTHKWIFEFCVGKHFTYNGIEVVTFSNGHGKIKKFFYHLYFMVFK